MESKPEIPSKRSLLFVMPGDKNELEMFLSSLPDDVKKLIPTNLDLEKIKRVTTEVQYPKMIFSYLDIELVEKRTLRVKYNKSKKKHELEELELYAEWFAHEHEA